MNDLLTKYSKHKKYIVTWCIFGIVGGAGLLSVFFFLFYPHTVQTQKNGLWVGYIVGIIVVVIVNLLIAKKLLDIKKNSDSLRMLR